MAFEFTDTSNNNQSGEGRENIVIPDRRYQAVFKGYREYTRTSAKTGETEPRLAWTFEIQGKKGSVEIPGFTSTKWGWHEKPSNSRKWMAALQGKKATDEDINRCLDEMIGLACEVQTVTLGEGLKAAKSIIDQVYPVVTDEDEESLPF